MNADDDRERRRRELEAAADELFDALYPEDLAALVARYNSRLELRAAAVDRAEKVIDRLANGADWVRSDEYGRLIAACLTWGRNQAGVAQKTTHATKKFLRYRRFPKLPFGILVRTDRIVPDDDRVIGLLARSLRIRSGVTDARPVGEPELILNMVVPAIVAALAPGTDQSPDPAADIALVGAALDVLERGAGLAAAYRVARRPVPVAGTDLPVAGNSDFLVRIAAYCLAIQERLGMVVTEPLDVLQQELVNLTSVLSKAMRRPALSLFGHGPNEPDVATAINQYASYLGSTARNDTLRQAVRRVHSVLNYQLDLDEPPNITPIEDIGNKPTPHLDGSELAVRLSDVEHLVGWLVAALFQGACRDAKDGLMEWLTGTPLPDQPTYMPLLVRRLRVATRLLDQTPASPPPRPDGVAPGQLDAVVARLIAAIDPEQIHGCERAVARLVTLDALPPLWTRRQPVISQLASHLRAWIGPRQALLVATYGVRAPVQAVQHTTSPLPVPCCPDGGTGGGSAVNGRPREPVSARAICPHRPWGEIGWVENYRTLGDAARFTAEATRRQLERYKGPWPELLWP